jgi:uncharacterized membrane protein YphA (DoxX/SURF4 family)
VASPRERRIPDALGALGRVLLALPFAAQGVWRIANPAAAAERVSAAGLPYAEPLSWLLAALELAGSAGLATGVGVVPAAAVLLLVHVPQAFVGHALLARASEPHAVALLLDAGIAGGLLLAAARGRR